MLRKSWILLLLVALLLAACGAQSAPTSTSGSSSSATSGASSSGAVGDAANGEKLFNQATLGKDNVAGCKTCHSIVKDQKIVGPSLTGIATDAEGTPKEADYEGSAKTAPEFLREAIVNPNVDIPEGYSPNTMPQNFKDELTPAQIDDLVAYLLTLRQQ